MIAARSFVAASATSSVEFSCDGGRATSLRFDGRELLRTGDARGGVWFGAFPMAPWAGLVSGARLHFDGRTHPLPANWGADSLHGVARLAEYHESDVGLVADLPPSWPFGGRFEISVAARDRSVELGFTITAGATAMPAAIGWHPWFARRIDGAEPLSFALPDGAEKMERTAEGVPTGRWVDPGDGPWDDCFQTDGAIQLRWPGAGTLRVSSDGGYLGLFDGEADGVAVEPMNAPAGTLPHRLEPGEELSLTVRLDWSPE